MEHIDLRQLSADELKQVRSQVVRLKEMGKTAKEIEEITGVRRNRISEIWTAYQRGGRSALRPKTRGRKAKEKMLLSQEESRQIRAKKRQCSQTRFNTIFDVLLITEKNRRGAFWCVLKTI